MIGIINKVKRVVLASHEVRNSRVCSVCGSEMQEQEFTLNSPSNRYGLQRGTIRLCSNRNCTSHAL